MIVFIIIVRRLKKEPLVSHLLVRSAVVKHHPSILFTVDRQHTAVPWYQPSADTTGGGSIYCTSSTGSIGSRRRMKAAPV